MNAADKSTSPQTQSLWKLWESRSKPLCDNPAALGEALGMLQAVRASEVIDSTKHINFLDDELGVAIQHIVRIYDAREAIARAPDNLTKVIEASMKWVRDSDYEYEREV